MNTDSLGGVVGELLSHNVFAYCKNNPIMYSDPSGHFPILIVAIIATIVIAPIVMAFAPTYSERETDKTQHYNRQSFNTGIPETYDDMQHSVSKGEYEQLPPSQSIYHKIGKYNKNNEKYVSKDGHKEAVFNPTTRKLVIDPVNMGTYNFNGPKDLFGLPHLFRDVIPYYIWGNSPDDPTNFFDRMKVTILGPDSVNIKGY
ncbi:hypothetical protein GOM49_17815 [Clostridium bovifaecis]|uniref:RHS repeat-associated core domain-containing protein n=1 Tax=Clostridium bovifaecis TaxID=2184719 RepID=A0A6I6EWH2_9CLOT|nr:hypothetical protein GOM49_17815 [Clostridium bovifaecis]